MKAVNLGCLSRLVSLKVLLISSFIVLMTVAGFLGYILTYLQSQKSLNDMAEVNIFDMAYSARTMIENRVAIGHQLNLQEYAFFQNQQLNITDWANAYYRWLPLTVNLMQPFKTTITGSGLLWLPNFVLSPSLLINVVLMVNFNGTVCTDKVHFNGSNCSISGMEQYAINPQTLLPIWQPPLTVNAPFVLTQQTYWKTGIMSRMDGRWTPTPSNPINLGYADIQPFMQVSPPMLNLQTNAGIFGTDGQAYGQIFKSISLNFIGVYLQNMTAGHPLLSQSGRAFSFEIGNGMLTGASHGRIYALQSSGGVNRFTPQQSEDPIIAAAGRALAQPMQAKMWSTSTDTSSTSAQKVDLKVRFSAVGKDFLCIADPLIDPFGLRWMTSVVLSLTDLFREMNEAAMRMLGWTALAIILLSIFAGLVLSLLMTRPLDTLATQMGIVADMDLESVDLRKSRLFEIATMQTYFHKMVANLKEFRTFLPEGILGGGSSGDSIAASEDAGDNPNPADAEQKTAAATRRKTNQSHRIVEEGQHREGNGSDYTSEHSGGKPAHHPHHQDSGDSPRASTSRSHGTEGGKDGERRKSHSHLDRDHPPYPHKHRQVNKQVGALTRRTVSTLLVDIKGFHHFFSQEEVLMSLHTTAMQRVMDVVQANGGMCSPFMGDRVFAYWNVRNMKSEHAMLCVTSALQIHHKFRQDPTPYLLIADDGGGEDHHNAAHAEPAACCPVHLACTTGMALFGTFGTQTSRAFTVVSASITRGTQLHKMSKLIPSGVLCDGPMFERIQYTFNTRLVSFLSFPDRNANAQVYEVMGPKVAAETDEWMYELKQQENASTGSRSEADFVMGVRTCFAGDSTASQRHFQQYLSGRCKASAPDPTAAWFLAHVEHVRLLMHPIWGLTLPLNNPVQP